MLPTFETYYTLLVNWLILLSIKFNMMVVPRNRNVGMLIWVDYENITKVCFFAFTIFLKIRKLHVIFRNAIFFVFQNISKTRRILRRCVSDMMILIDLAKKCQFNHFCIFCSFRDTNTFITNF